MRILLDSCVPKRLGDTLRGHQVRTAPELGWGDLDDGPLLDTMADRFDVLITVDKNLPKEQNVSLRNFGVVLLRAKSNRLDDLLPLMAELINALRKIRPGEVREISGLKGL